MSEVFFLVGGAGFIGKNLLAELLKSGKKVVVFDRSYPVGCEGWTFEFEKGDLNDSVALRNALSRHRATVVVHLVTTILPGTAVDELDRAIYENITPFHGLLGAMSDLGVGKIVFYSSGGTVYGTNGLRINSEEAPTKPINLYGWVKLATEQCIQMYCYSKGLEYKIIRPSNAYGRGQNVFRPQGIIGVAMNKILRREPVQIWGTGENIRDYIYINDMSTGAVSIIQEGRWNRVYNLGSGKGHSVREVLLILRDICGSDWEEQYAAARNVDIDCNILDISRVTVECDWKPKVELEEGMLRTWEWLKSLHEGGVV